MVLQSDETQRINNMRQTKTLLVVALAGFLSAKPAWSQHRGFVHDAAGNISQIVDLDNDRNNCGTIGNVCAGVNCAQGCCGPTACAGACCQSSQVCFSSACCSPQSCNSFAVCGTRDDGCGGTA